ncbi:bifunctional DNA primase/polymerase [Lactiplantibacillus plantarum]|uniref:bifunctional DNA primase/polymerase n=1 Tax=Lactiplantibacillus plantarum TaxID=1590 RepID=UPI00223832EB|nr:bifunctional DNA primase/polymerase [Lactiplantibacillus plantarum]MCW6116203.1 bifunctional DNA primase/polymerase [Lactiplantibacillus plantarum]
MKVNDRLTRALQLARDGVAVYPLASNSKVPLKGTQGYKDATTDVETIKGWFEHVPRANLGIRLDQVKLLVVDIDRHGDIDGVQTLKRLNEHGKTLPSDTYIEQTPNDGLHYFFKLPDKLDMKRRTGLYPGIDVLTDFVVVAPSSINERAYRAIEPANQIATAPQWLLDDLLPSQRMNKAPQHTSQIQKTWAGRMLDDLVAGTGEGSRNSYLTSLLGKLLRTGCNGMTAYELLQYANEQLQPPLPDKEVNTIFKSIIKRT